MFLKLIKTLSFLFTIVVLALAAGCNATPPVSPDGEPTHSNGPVEATTTTVPVAPTDVPTPTATPEPLALRVNGEGISMVEFQVELRQIQEAHQILGKNVAVEEQRQQVLDNIIETVLLAQGASEAGFHLDDAALQAEISRLASEMSGEQALTDWIVQQGYTETLFRSVLRRQMAAAWQRDKIADEVPVDAEQIHARQILTTDEEIARLALNQVNLPGVNFAAQAMRYDPVSGGDLGWFPRGYLIQPEVEEAAFQLQPGQISPIVQSTIGYHIIQVISREPLRVLSPDARRILQHKVLSEWIDQRRSSSQVEILAP